jgi:antitoxin component of RelBE/YafQ-DinJ toxin-antitoxin module
MSQTKKHLKNTNFNMRIDPQLKADFVAVTEDEDVSAGHALRAFMRRYVAKRRYLPKDGAKHGDRRDQRT